MLGNHGAVGLALGEGEAEPAALVCAGAFAPGVAIGFAGAGVFCANSTTVSFIASSTGIRTTPLLLFAQPYVVSALVASSRAAWSFSVRTFARLCS